MATNKVIINYNRELDKSLDNLGRTAATSLEGNGHFTWTNGELQTLQGSSGKFSEDLGKVANGGSIEVASKNASRILLLETLNSVALEVNRQADGDLVKLQSSGLRLAKNPSPTGVLPKPSGFKVVSGANSGELLCSVDANSSASVYLFFWTTVPAPNNMGDWHQVASTVRRKTISGLVPGTQYALRVAYQGAEPTLIYSDIITIYAQ